jgi:hypothetical protein
MGHGGQGSGRALRPRVRGSALAIGAAALLAALLLTLAAASGAEAAPKKKPVRVSAQGPQVVLAGTRVAVRGKVRARGKKLRAQARTVYFQQRVGRRWVVRARGMAKRRGGRFTLRWRAPERNAVLKVRVVAGKARRPLAKTGQWRVSITRTSVLRPGRVVSAPPPGQPGVLQYRGRVDVAKGTFVALDAGAATPFGLLGRVTGVDRNRHQTSISLEPATLPQAIPEGSFSVGGASASSKARAAATARPFTNNLSCDAGVEASLRGSVSVDIEPRMAVRWSWFRVKSAETSVKVTGAAELAAAISGAASCSLAPTQVASWDAPPLRFSIGPVPVVIVPRATLSIAASAQASASASTSINGSVTAKAGLRVDNGVHPIGEFGHTFSYTAPQATVKASLGAQAIPAVSFLLYGIAGPQFDLSAGLQLNAHPASRPWWKLTAPVKLDARLAVPGFDSFGAGPVTVYQRSFDIASASTATVDPAGGPAPVAGERARIDWDTDDTDVDLHIWDEFGNHAYFSQQEEIPDANLSVDITTGFGPEIFTDQFSPSTRDLTYGLCYYSDHGHGPTNVTVRLIDPDGGIRTSQHHLALSKDRVLLGASPAGATGYVPDDDWC